MTIQRFETGPRMSQIVIHGNTVYGQVRSVNRVGMLANRPSKFWPTIDELLAKAGTDKTRILQAIIWLADMQTFAEMNKEWDKWVPQGNTPARATGEAKLASPQYNVEIMVVAAK